MRGGTGMGREEIGWGNRVGAIGKDRGGNEGFGGRGTGCGGTLGLGGGTGIG